METYRSVVTVREQGDFLVERQQRWGNGWVTTDRYKTVNLSKPPKAKDRTNGRKLKREGKDNWITKLVTACSQPSAEIQIDIPPIPALEQPRETRLEVACDLMYAKIMELERKPSLPCPCSACTKEREECQQAQSS